MILRQFVSNFRKIIGEISESKNNYIVNIGKNVKYIT